MRGARARLTPLAGVLDTRKACASALAGRASATSSSHGEADAHAQSARRLSARSPASSRRNAAVAAPALKAQIATTAAVRSVGTRRAAVAATTRVASVAATVRRGGLCSCMSPLSARLGGSGIPPSVLVGLRQGGTEAGAERRHEDDALVLQLEPRRLLATVGGAQLVAVLRVAANHHREDEVPGGVTAPHDRLRAVELDAPRSEDEARPHLARGRGDDRDEARPARALDGDASAPDRHRDR